MNVMPLTPDQIGMLDPGVRELIVWLRSEGFETVDSGDGITKTDMDCAWPSPNVAIEVKPSDMISEADRLRHLLIGKFIRPRQANMEDEPHIQATYDPVDKSAILILVNVTDAMLRGERDKWNDAE